MPPENGFIPCSVIDVLIGTLCGLVGDLIADQTISVSTRSNRTKGKTSLPSVVKMFQTKVVQQFDEKASKMGLTLKQRADLVGMSRSQYCELLNQPMSNGTSGQPKKVSADLLLFKALEIIARGEEQRIYINKDSLKTSLEKDYGFINETRINGIIETLISDGMIEEVQILTEHQY